MRQRLRWRTRENTPAKFPSGLELAPAGPQAGRGFSFNSALGWPYLNARKSVLLRRICAVSRPESFMTVGMVRGRGKGRDQSPRDIEEFDRRCFIVRDNNGQALAYVYFEANSGTSAGSVPPQACLAACLDPSRMCGIWSRSDRDYKGSRDMY